MGVVTRILRGSPLRKTRFHDEKGNLVDPGGMAYAPAALATAVLRTAFGYRAAVPTVSFRARKVIVSLLDGDSKVVEFGSGMSTPWLARRCGFLLSIEDDARWFSEVQALLARRCGGPVRYFVDFSPTHFFVEQGMLVRVTAHS